MKEEHNMILGNLCGCCAPASTLSERLYLSLTCTLKNIIETRATQKIASLLFILFVYFFSVSVLFYIHARSFDSKATKERKRDVYTIVDKSVCEQKIAENLTHWKMKTAKKNTHTQNKKKKIPKNRNFFSLFQLLSLNKSTILQPISANSNANRRYQWQFILFFIVLCIYYSLLKKGLQKKNCVFRQTN